MVFSLPAGRCPKDMFVVMPRRQRTFCYFNGTGVLLRSSFISMIFKGDKGEGDNRN